MEAKLGRVERKLHRRSSYLWEIKSRYKIKLGEKKVICNLFSLTSSKAEAS